MLELKNFKISKEFEYGYSRFFLENKHKIIKIIFDSKTLTYVFIRNKVNKQNTNYGDGCKRSLKQVPNKYKNVINVIEVMCILGGDKFVS